MSLSSVRRRLEEREEFLAPNACRVVNTQGRDVPEDPSPLRTDFQRDRDRILHTNSFRRLKHKTQVFIAPTGDHYATRLTHTLEVSQIARTIARGLNLNEDLVEAIALGHDMGHTPFGHIGEALLAEFCPGGFRHSQQSLRIVETLEKGGRGLNLTWEVRQGIVAHSKPRGNFLAKNSGEFGLSLEAQTVRISDAVAYLNHDIADAIRAGVLNEEELPAEARKSLGTRHSQRINTMVSDIVLSSLGATTTKVKSAPLQITMSTEASEALFSLREFLFERVYEPAGNGEEGEVAHAVLSLLYPYLCENSSQIPEPYLSINESTDKAASDYIASMTDYYALQLAEKIKPGISRSMLQWGRGSVRPFLS